MALEAGLGFHVEVAAISTNASAVGLQRCAKCTPRALVGAGVALKTVQAAVDTGVPLDEFVSSTFYALGVAEGRPLTAGLALIRTETSLTRAVTRQASFSLHVKEVAYTAGARAIQG